MPVEYLNSNPWQKLNDLFAISRHFISLRMKAIRLAASTGRKVFSFRTRNKQQEEERNNGRKRTSRNTCPAGGSGLGAYPLPKNSRKTPENSRKNDKNSREVPLNRRNSTENSRKLYRDGRLLPPRFFYPYLCTKNHRGFDTYLLLTSKQRYDYDRPRIFSSTGAAGADLDDWRHAGVSRGGD